MSENNQKGLSRFPDATPEIEKVSDRLLNIQSNLNDQPIEPDDRSNSGSSGDRSGPTKRNFETMTANLGSTTQEDKKLRR